MTSLSQKKKPSLVPQQQQQEASFARYEERIKDAYVETLEELDAAETANWAYIVAKVIEGGVTKEVLCKELSYDWSTFTRWRAGQSAPPVFTRGALKQEFIRLLKARRGGR